MSPSLAAIYQLDEKTQVWSRPGYSSIFYNDGNDVEQRLLDIVSSSEDCSVLSIELRSRCTDWPSLYHLSSSRANILRPFEPQIQGKVLEIGAGCGAITRYLGECGAEVLALEGTVRRATICRSRTRDLANVTVLAENFSAFETDEKFDVVTLIGVLEYASMFVQDANPDLAMLKRAKALLKPGGQLIIAIENQLGLKYFAGAPEDHVGTVSFGLEDRYVAGGVRTYGRRAIDALLNKGGFARNRFFACFPDYKLPVSIISELGFQTPDFDPSALAIQSVKRDPQLPAMLAFRPERVWGPLVDNGVALDLANSFLISARSNAEGDQKLDETLAWHFSTERRPDFCKVTRFEKKATHGIEVHATRARKNDNPRTEIHGLTNDIRSSSTYTRGQVFATLLTDMITRDAWDDDNMRAFIQDYLTLVSQISGQQIEPLRLFDEDIPGTYVDATPQNFIKDEYGVFHLIDTEWKWDRAISPAYLLFRAMYSITLNITKIGRHKSRNIKTRADLIATSFESIGQTINENSIKAFSKMEQSLQILVSAQPQTSENIQKFLNNLPIDTPNTWEFNEDLNRTINEKNNQIQSLQKALLDQKAEIDYQISELKRSLKEHQLVIIDREDTLRKLLNSLSWRITKPFRYLSRLFTPKDVD